MGAACRTLLADYLRGATARETHGANEIPAAIATLTMVGGLEKHGTTRAASALFSEPRNQPNGEDRLEWPDRQPHHHLTAPFSGGLLPRSCFTVCRASVYHDHLETLVNTASASN